VDHAGIGWTKLTGAGGGGCSITILKPNVQPVVLKDLENKLAEEGFEKYETSLGGAGVGVLWPAVTRTAADDAEVEITQEMFLGADGVKGVEVVAGVDSEGKRAWRFWHESSAGDDIE